MEPKNDTSTSAKRVLGATASALLATGLAVCAAESAVPAARPESSVRSPSALMEAWRTLEHAPILHYQWNGARDAVERGRRLEDYLEMGITGIYKIDQAAPDGGRLFLDRGLHGLMRQARFAGGGDPVIGSDGQPAFPGRPHPYRKSVFSPRNAAGFYERELAFAREYGPSNLFTVGSTIVMSSWDETGLYSRREKEYGYTAREEFAAFLRDVIFGDASPSTDTNGDGRTFQSETGLKLKTWEEAPLPAFAERFDKPGLWKLWCDFHGYYTHLFFRRGGMAVGKGIDRDVEMFTFSHASVKWPNTASSQGLDLYWQARLNRVMTVEDCQSSYPGPTIHYAFTDQLSRRYGLPVLGWSWYSPDYQRAREPLDAARSLARAMGHNTHGLMFYVYMEDEWRAKPAMRESIARWHRIYQAHWPFLRQSTAPAPRVAVLFPRNTANMYARLQYPKLDYGWTCQALSEAHIPFDIVADNQVEQEPAVLSDYTVLLVLSAPWHSPRFRAALEGFLQKGGYVYADGDSLMLDTSTGTTTDMLARHFGVQPRRKHKGLFSPTCDSEAEAAWAAAPEHDLPKVRWEGDVNRSRFRARGEQAAAAELGSDLMKLLGGKLPPFSGSGLPQVLLDPRTPHLIHADEKVGVSVVTNGYRTYHDIVTAEICREDATPIARYGNEICAIETPRTVWTGFRPGFDHACLFPVYQMRVWGEDIWPFEINQAVQAEQRRGPREWLCRIVRKAGIEPPIEVVNVGISASHVEVLVRRDPLGNALIWLINHEGIGGEHLVSGSGLAGAQSVCELRTGAKPQPDAKGRYAIDLAPLDVAILAVGSDEFVQERLKAQQAIPTIVREMPAYE